MHDTNDSDVMIDEALLRRAAELGSATLHEALGRAGNLPHEIKPVASGMRACGRAFTVESPAGSNLALHHAIYAASAGDVLVVSVRGGFDYGYWGEIMSHAAIQRRLGGLVIDGCVRDAELLERFGFPVFARGLCIRGTDKFPGGALASTVVIGATAVSHGDLVVADRDGVVVIAKERLAATMQSAAVREEKERVMLERLSAGATTLELRGLPKK